MIMAIFICCQSAYYIAYCYTLLSLLTCPLVFQRVEQGLMAHSYSLCVLLDIMLVLGGSREEAHDEAALSQV